MVTVCRLRGDSLQACGQCRLLLNFKITFLQWQWFYVYQAADPLISNKNMNTKEGVCLLYKWNKGYMIHLFIVPVLDQYCFCHLSSEICDRLPLKECSKFFHVWYRWSHLLEVHMQLWSCIYIQHERLLLMKCKASWPVVLNIWFPRY